jgi:hypothetical protein
VRHAGPARRDALSAALGRVASDDGAPVLALARQVLADGAGD